MKAALYIRVSTSEQNTDLQKSDLLQFTSARGWETTVYEDHGKSGTNTNRPELQRLFRDARQRKIDIVICWKMDRLFRSLKDLVNTLSEWEALGVSFVSLKDNIDMTTPAGKLLMQILGAMAEFEASLIRERVRAGIAARKAKGKRIGRARIHSHESIHDLRASGLTNSAIAKQIGCSRSLVTFVTKTSHLL